MAKASTIIVLALFVVSACAFAPAKSSSCPQKATFAAQQQRGNFTLITLPYPETFLQSQISQQIVNLHYGTHHAGYVAKLNTFIAANPQYANYDLVTLLQYVGNDPNVQKFAGGDYNHNLYWWTLTNSTCFQNPSGSLAATINKQWGNFSNFQNEFNTIAGTVFGSGWTWLSAFKNGTLTIVNSANQLSPLVNRKTFEAVPILGVDLWEHAYYLEYLANRAGYVSTWWSIIDWPQVEYFYTEYALKGVPVPF